MVDAGNTGHGAQDRGDKRCWEVCNSPHFPGKVTNDPASPEGTGYEVDKLSAKHVKKHFDSYIGEILRRIPAEERKTLTTIVIDSWEAGTQNYTDDIFDRFKARFGYDLDYANPAHASDLKTLVGELVVSEFMGTMVKCAQENGLKVWTEPHAWGTFPADPTAYVAMADEGGTEFWDKGPKGNIDRPEGPWKADWLKKAEGTPWKEGRWSDPCPFWEEEGKGKREEETDGLR